MHQLLAISGSLRAVSVNTALLRAMQQIAPHDVIITLYAELGDLPLFNPDLEGKEPPVVQRLWRQVAAANGLVIASPEYAHGVSGAMKNALDWLVGGPEFFDKPVAVLNAAPRATHALAALQETIRTMNGRLIEPASLTIPVGNKPVTVEAILRNAEFTTAIHAALHAFQKVLRTDDPT